VGLTPVPGESYEQWVNRVKQYETGRALMELASGADPEQVLIAASNRMVAKFQHPVLEAVNNIPSDYNSTESLENYRTNYQDRFGPKPDHVKED
jgi:glutamyl-tRNA reductase